MARTSSEPVQFKWGVKGSEYLNKDYREIEHLIATSVAQDMDERGLGIVTDNLGNQYVIEITAKIVKVDANRPQPKEKPHGKRRGRE